jgi:hypothetical protein
MRLKVPALSLDIEPSLEDIRKALSDIQSVNEDPFVILERTTMTYLQTAYSTGGYQVECQFESTEKHFTAKRTLTYGEVVKVFELYFKGDTAWKRGIEFELTNRSRHAAFKIGFLAGNVLKKIGGMFGRK